MKLIETDPGRLAAVALFPVVADRAINLHLGLSPRYRGAACLFWPFYFMEPAFAGSTVHYIVYEPDAGNIVHQVTPELEREDGIHDVGCKTVIASARDIGKLLNRYAADGKWDLRTQKSTGKNFLYRDFRPEHLRVNYDLFNDRMVESYLAGNLTDRRPKLVRQF